MAEIKMDVSEYNEIMENKKLLKESLEREKELNDQIQKLNKEKLKAYEDAKMQVVYQNKKVIEEVNIESVDVDELYGYMTHRRYDGRSGRYIYEKSPFVYSENILNRFIRKTKVVREEPTEITVKGLDEVKIELRKDIESKLDKEIYDKISKYDKLSKIIGEKDKEISSFHKKELTYLDEIDSLNKHIESVEHNFEKKVKECSELSSKLSKQKESLETINEIRSILSDGFGKVFNKSSLLNKISKLVNKDYY